MAKLSSIRMDALMGLGSDKTDGNELVIFTDADELQPAKSTIRIRPPIFFIANAPILKQHPCYF